MKNLTTGQWLGIVLAILGVLAASTAQLNELFGPAVAKTIGTIANLTMSIMSAVLVVLTGQSAQVQAVQAMPGVEKIVVNENANQTLASMAVDPQQKKIETAPGTASAVAETARGS